MKYSQFTKRSVLSIIAATCVLSSCTANAATSAPVTADFNGDGYQDLITGQPYEDFGNLTNPGAVKVVYGKNKGGMNVYSQTAFIHQSKSGGIGGIHLTETAEISDMFGDRIAIGDFNDDGYDDVAIGVKGEDLNGLNNAGIVHIVYGSEEGLTEANNHTLDLTKVRSGRYAHAQSNFGVALSVGDFDGDGVDDLAAGFLGVSPIGQNDSTVHGGGAVIFFGDAEIGLLNADISSYTRTLPRYYNTANQNDYYGGRLASGDFDGDGYDDLAISAFKADLMIGDIGRRDAGAVWLQYGVDDWRYTYTISPKIVPNRKDVNGHFGFSMTAADLNNDNRQELIIGTPGSGIGGNPNSGAVVVARVRPNGSITQSWYYQSQSLFSGTSRKDDRFGHALTVADFNGDDVDDIAIGIPYRDRNSHFSFLRIRNTGEVQVIYGSGYGGFSYSQVWHQDTMGVDEVREENDYFGYTLGAGDFNHDDNPDLVVGVPFEDIGSIYNAGIIQILRGQSGGLSASIPGTQVFSQLSFSGWGFGSGIATTENEMYDYFGWSL